MSKTPTDFDSLALRVAEREGLKKQMSIAQIRECLRIGIEEIDMMHEHDVKCMIESVRERRIERERRSK